MRGPDHVWQVDEGCVRCRRFLLEDINARASDTAGFERADEGGFVDNWSTGDVDENGGRLHSCQTLSVDEVVGGGVVGQGNRDTVGFRKGLILFD